MNASMTITGAAPLQYRAGKLRDYVFPLIAALAVFALPFTYVMYAYILVGQAHFLMAYLYQYRGGKITKTYLFVALALGAAATLYLTSGIGITPLFIIAGTIFSAHFALDQFTLHGEPLSPFTYRNYCWLRNLALIAYHRRCFPYALIPRVRGGRRTCATYPDTNLVWQKCAVAR